MNTNMKELNLNELEMVNGGWDWKKYFSKEGLKGIATMYALAGPIGVGMLVLFCETGDE